MKRLLVEIALRVAAMASAGLLCFAQQPGSSRRMPDGKEWTTANLDVTVDGSYCYGDTEANCRRYGRLYTWGAAQRGCRALGDGWRLPADDEWRQLAKHYGGVREDSDDAGKAAYAALLTGGHSGFNAVMGWQLHPGRCQIFPSGTARILLVRIRNQSGHRVVLQLRQRRAVY